MANFKRKKSINSTFCKLETENGFNYKNIKNNIKKTFFEPGAFFGQAVLRKIAGPLTSLLYDLKC